MIVTVSLFVLIAYGALGMALFLLQRSILYRPDAALGTPGSYQLEGFEAFTLPGEDGMPLTVWSFPPAGDRPTIFYFHGNAGHLGMRADAFAGLAAHGFGVLALSYRGYGGSGGTPTEQGLYQDARHLLAYGKNMLNLNDKQIILFGESLGSGVAVQMATEMHPAMLVLESPYTSITARGQALYPYMPVRLILRDKFDSLSKIGRVNSPVLIFHGDKDMVVPSSDGRALLAAANEPKKGLFYPDRGHIDFSGVMLAEEIEKFGREQQLISPPLEGGLARPSAAMAEPGGVLPPTESLRSSTPPQGGS